MSEFDSRRPQPTSTQDRIPHSGKLAPEDGGEKPVELFDNTSLEQAVESGLISDVNVLDSLTDEELAVIKSMRQNQTNSPDTARKEKKGKKGLIIGSSIAAVAIGAGAWAISSTGNDGDPGAGTEIESPSVDEQPSIPTEQGTDPGQLPEDINLPPANHEGLSPTEMRETYDREGSEAVEEMLVIRSTDISTQDDDLIQTANEIAQLYTERQQSVFSFYETFTSDILESGLSLPNFVQETPVGQDLIEISRSLDNYTPNPDSPGRGESDGLYEVALNRIDTVAALRPDNETTPFTCELVGGSVSYETLPNGNMRVMFERECGSEVDMTSSIGAERGGPFSNTYETELLVDLSSDGSIIESVVTNNPDGYY